VAKSKRFANISPVTARQNGEEWQGTGMTERAYLDWNATAPLRPQARAALLEAFDQVGNPSSVHAEGRAGRHLVEEARRAVAAVVGADPRDVTFTSGATEANALALAPAPDGFPERLLVSAIEHPSVRCGGRFPAAAVEEIPVTPAGIVDLAALARRMEELRRDGCRPAVSIMLANNETGVVQPVAAAADLVHAVDGTLHVDVVQGFGRIPFQLNELRADSLAVSGHKIGATMGTGALIRAGGRPPEPLIRGGAQERGLRAGTENTAALAGFGAAARAAPAAMAADGARMAALRDRLEAGLRQITPDVVVFGTEAERVPNTCLFALPGMKAETAVIAFDLEGVAVSAGAACSSGKVQPSQVLAAMGVPPALARAAVRVSLGWTSAESDVLAFLSALKRLAQVLIKERKNIAVAAA
jgi:cysteine desulfurase